MTKYIGTRTDQGCTVTYDEGPLDPRLDLRNHSPTGFEWGFHGSGPAQLSLAILCCQLGDDKMACRLYQSFKRNVIGNLSRDNWTLTLEDVAKWVREFLVANPKVAEEAAEEKRWASQIAEWERKAREEES